jgi:hypothetical protein
MKRILFLSLQASIIHIGVSFAQQDTIFYDQATGNYVIQYVGDSVTGERDSLIRVVFEPATKISPFVQCTTTFDEKSGSYLYSYSIENGSQSLQNLYKFILEFGQNAKIDDLSRGFWHSRRLKQIDTLLASIVAVNRWSWRADNGLKAGGRTSGFLLRSPDPPGIVNSYFQGFARPLEFPDEGPPDAIRAQLSALSIFPANHVVCKTIAPTAIPTSLTAMALLDTLISYKHQAFNLGWITNKGILNSLDQKLDNARKQLERGNNKSAKNILEAFINEVEAQKDKHLSGEAYALLKFNAQYLISKL